MHDSATDDGPGLNTATRAVCAAVDEGADMGSKDDEAKDEGVVRGRMGKGGGGGSGSWLVGGGLWLVSLKGARCRRWSCPVPLPGSTYLCTDMHGTEHAHARRNPPPPSQGPGLPISAGPPQVHDAITDAAVSRVRPRPKMALPSTAGHMHRRRRPPPAVSTDAPASPARRRHGPGPRARQLLPGHYRPRHRRLPALLLRHRLRPQV